MTSQLWAAEAPARCSSAFWDIHILKILFLLDCILVSFILETQKSVIGQPLWIFEYTCCVFKKRDYSTGRRTGHGHWRNTDAAFPPYIQPPASFLPCVFLGHRWGGSGTLATAPRCSWGWALLLTPCWCIALAGHTHTHTHTIVWFSSNTDEKDKECFE